MDRRLARWESCLVVDTLAGMVDGSLGFPGG